MTLTALALVNLDDESGPQLATREAALLARALGGDRSAMRVLYEEHASATRRFLRLLLGDRDRTDDALQETFARALSSLGQIPDDAPFGRWILGVARNVARERWRERTRDGQPGMARDDEGESLEPTATAASAESAESLLLGRELAEKVAEALERMSPDRRAIFVMRTDLELPYDEIAAAVGCTVAKVKVELHRARAALRAHVAPHATRASKGSSS